MRQDRINLKTKRDFGNGYALLSLMRKAMIAASLATKSKLKQFAMNLTVPQCLNLESRIPSLTRC